MKKKLDSGDDNIAKFDHAILIIEQIKKEAEVSDAKNLIDPRTASALERLRNIESDAEIYFVLNQVRFLTRDYKVGADVGREDYAYTPDVRMLLEDIYNDISKASLEFSLPEIELLRNPVLLVEGEAGIGKSHILAREVQCHVQQGHPAVLVPARTLDQGNRPESEILRYLDLDGVRFETFLGALEAAAKASGYPALIAIDGINESHDAAGWEPGLPKLISQIHQFDQIALCVSIRSAYQKLCIRPNLSVVTIRHPGFSANLGDAARQYLDRHGIERPSAPIFELRDILYNPLFLSTAVDFLIATKQTSFPRGLDSVGNLIDFWLEAIEINLITKGYDRLQLGDGNIRKAAESIAAKMAENGTEYLEFKAANVICEQITDLAPPAKAADRLLARLIDEGMLLDSPNYIRSDRGKDISFAFQKFSDYFIADAIVRETGNMASLAAAVKRGGKYHYLFDEAARWGVAGPRSALFALTALRFGRELIDLEADGDQLSIYAADFVDSLHWRHRDAIFEETQEILEAIWGRMSTSDEYELTDETYFDVLLRLAAVPQCRLNAYYLKERLKGMTLADRDAIWSLYLVRKTRAYDEEWPIVRELIDWSWMAPAANIGSEKVHLIAITVALMTSTMDREVRDSATKALSSLLMKCPAEIAGLIEEFKDWDDPYVRERVLAAAMGGALYCRDAGILKLAAEAADRMVFAKTPIERHAWVRRYAHLIILHAGLRGATLDADLISRATPPYKSSPITEWPTLSDLLPFYEDARAIFSSTIGYLSEKDGSAQPIMPGDFGRYTISGIDTSFSAEMRGDEPPVSRDMIIEKFWSDAENCNPSTAKLRIDLEVARARRAERSMVILIKRGEDDARPFSGIRRDDADETEDVAADNFGSGSTDDNGLPSRFDDSFRDLEASLLSLLSPELSDRYLKLNPLAFRADGQIEKFSIQSARNWIVDRALKLGWDHKVHDSIERQELLYSHGRHDHNVERIGKKYQHIAHQELIGYLADYHWYLDWGGQASILRELEQFNRCDIDPSYLASEFSKEALTFFPGGLRTPEMRFIPSDARANIEWTETLLDIPDVIPYLIQTDVAAQKWYIQRSFLRSIGYMDNVESAAPFRSAQLSIELVLFNSNDVSRLDALNTELLNGDDNDIFDGSYGAQFFYGQRSALHLPEPMKFELAFETSGIKFGRFVESYSPKFGEYDCSGIFSDRGFSVPSAAFTSIRKLRQNNAWSTYYVDEDERPAFLPHGGLQGDDLIVVRADVIEAAASESLLKPVWIVWAEKDGGEGAYHSAAEERLFARNDFIGFYYELDGAWHGRLFRFRNSVS